LFDLVLESISMVFADVGRTIGRSLLVALWLAIHFLHTGRGVAEEESRPSAVGPVLRLYQSGRLPPERQPAVVEMICSRGNQYDLRVVYDQLLSPDGMEPELRRKTLGWLNDAAVNRRVKPDGDLSGMTRLLESPDAAERSAAVRLAANWQVAEVAPILAAIAQEAESSAELQRIAIQGLVALQGADAEPTLVKLAESSESESVRLQAVSALTGVNLPVAAKWATAVFAEVSTQHDLGPVLNAFFERREGADLLAEAIQTNPPDADTAKRVIRHMLAVGRSDANLTAVLSEAAGVSPDPMIPTPEEVAVLSQEAMERGDPHRGEKVFRRDDLNCFRCHALHGAGGQVGPDLSPLGGSSPMDYIVNSILNPDIAVKEQYATRVFETVDGRVLTGVVVDRDDARVRIRDAQGDLLIIPADDVDYEAEGRSMMPEGLTKFLTRQETLDLIRFVSELGKPGPYGPRSAPILQRWQMLNEPPAELIDDVPHLEHLRQYVFDTLPEQWKPVYAMFSGVVPLDELREADKPKVVILRGEIQVHESGLLGVEVTTSESCQVWLGGQSIMVGERVEIPIEHGRHFVTARVEISDRQDPGVKVEFYRPDGSPVQFEVVAGP
jgi:putative heme-binding domain-containing protein